MIAGSRLYVVGNTLVDDSTGGGTAVLLGGDVTGRVEVRNNVVVDFATLTAGAAGVRRGNCVTTKPRFRGPRRLDYWLRPGSACRDVATTDARQGRRAASLTPLVALPPPDAPGAARRRRRDRRRVRHARSAAEVRRSWSRSRSCC